MTGYRLTVHGPFALCRYFCIEIRKAEGEKEFVGYLSRTAYSGFS